jgi:acetyl esterase/lipase
MGRRVAASGVVAASMNYRLAPEHTYPAQVEDCFCALSWLRAHASEYGVDPDRIAVMGYSAGGHLVGMLGLAASIPSLQDDCPWGPTGAPNAVIMGAGPSDLRGRDHWVIQDFLGGSEEDLPAIYVEASPMTHVAPGAPPFLFVHATQDWFVSIDDSVALRDALRAEGNDARLLDLVGGGHLLNEGVDLGHWYGRMSLEAPEAWLAIDDFLDRTVGREVE